MKDEFHYDDALARLQVDLTELLKQRAQLDQRILAMRMSIVGFLRLKNPMFGEDMHSDPRELRSVDEVMQERLSQLSPPWLVAVPKLTDACRAILQSAPRPLTAAEVRRELEVTGFDFSRYHSNPLSAIHTVLKRLADSGQAESGSNAEGRATFRWKDDLTRVVDMDTHSP